LYLCAFMPLYESTYFCLYKYLYIFAKYGYLYDARIKMYTHFIHLYVWAKKFRSRIMNWYLRGICIELYPLILFLTTNWHIQSNPSWFHEYSIYIWMWINPNVDIQRYVFLISFILFVSFLVHHLRSMFLGFHVSSLQNNHVRNEMIKRYVYTYIWINLYIHMKTYICMYMFIYVF
jgi:hypothetical protein